MNRRKPANPNPKTNIQNHRRSLSKPGTKMLKLTEKFQNRDQLTENPEIKTTMTMEQEKKISIPGTGRK